METWKQKALSELWARTHTNERIGLRVMDAADALNLIGVNWVAIPPHMLHIAEWLPRHFPLCITKSPGGQREDVLTFCYTSLKDCAAVAAYERLSLNTHANMSFKDLTDALASSKGLREADIRAAFDAYPDSLRMDGTAVSAGAKRPVVNMPSEIQTYLCNLVRSACAETLYPLNNLLQREAYIRFLL